MLAHVFEKFRNTNLKSYAFCASYYLSPSALRWDAMLILAKVDLQLIQDPNYIEKGTRDGVYYVSNKYWKINENYLKSNDPRQESNILYT